LYLSFVLARHTLNIDIDFQPHIALINKHTTADLHPHIALTNNTAALIQGSPAPLPDTLLQALFLKQVQVGQLP